MFGNKSLALAILFGNCLAFFIYSGLIGSYNTEQIKFDVNDTGSITNLKVPYRGKEPKFGLEFLDYIIGLWFVLSTAWCLWVLLNPVIP
jgi:hypothetical protein